MSDTGNHRIRKVTGSTISTWAGNGLGRFLGDGASAAGSALNRPQAVEADSQGNLFIADVYNNRIRKIFSNGNISTVAGNGLFGYSGDGLLRFWHTSLGGLVVLLAALQLWQDWGLKDEDMLKHGQ